MRLVWVKAHEVRAVATSALFMKIRCIPAILRAGTWKSMSTFASFDLRDITHRYLDTFSLGPVVSVLRFYVLSTMGFEVLGPFSGRELLCSSHSSGFVPLSWDTSAAPTSGYGLRLVAQEDDHPLVEQEVNRINGALALLGHANHKNNLVRRFVMKREINQKYSHLCFDKWPMSCMLFGDDVSQSAKQIEDTEKLEHKFAAKKNPVPWRFTGGRSRGFWENPLEVLLAKVPALWTAEGLQGWPTAIPGSSGPRLKKRQGPGSVQALTLTEVSNNFEAGRLHKFVNVWRQITKDPVILDTVLHCHLDINNSDIKHLFSGERTYRFSLEEQLIIGEEIKKLLGLKVLVITQRKEAQLLSPIFLRPKKNGGYKMVPNLKRTKQLHPLQTFQNGKL
ncbi:hypothetical protein E2C01_049081 [Portunus trituberculatus]|uniref:Uncharacterized protein n=1 Tax=Portunus trituberculatus TaxID=210409 RepID=A0A5B7G4P9_PORTR|nr:hypothetical protein [Portunus trituberculatus]